jgi:endogenous inhibitor of DNA gyrase (YacG/DUF329 family)
MPRCPGQDPRFWKPGNIFDVKCPGCGKNVEFFKDEPKMKCRNCGRTMANPKLDLGCAQWCQYAQQCLEVSGVKNLRVIQDKLIGPFGEDRKRQKPIKK